MSNPAQHYYDVFNDVRNPIPPELAVTGLDRDTLLKILKVQAWLYEQLKVSTS